MTEGCTEKIFVLPRYFIVIHLLAPQWSERHEMLIADYSCLHLPYSKMPSASNKAGLQWGITQIRIPSHEGRVGADKSPVLYLLSTLSVRMKTLRYLQHSLEGAAPLISSMHPRDSAQDGGRTYVTSLLSIDIIIEEIELAMLLNTSLREKKIYIYIRDCSVLWSLDKCSSRCKRQLDMNIEEDCIVYYSSKIHKFVMKAHLL